MNPQNATQITGTILLCKTGPIFISEIHLNNKDNGVVDGCVPFAKFQRFCRYIHKLGLFKNSFPNVNCDFNTLKMAFHDFEEMEQNQYITSVLYPLEIYPSAPEVKALNLDKKGAFNFWLMCTRLFRTFGKGRVFHFKNPRQINLPQ